MEILELESVKTGLNKILNEYGFKDSKISLSPGSKPGDNYGSDTYKLLMRKNNSQLNLFMKLVRQNSINLHPFFKREALIYTTIIPKYLDIQNERNVTDKFKSTSKCYGASSIEGEEYIILADLSVDGFKLRDKCATIDFNHCKLAMEALGKLHALSFALNDKYPEFVEQYKDQFSELMFKNPLSDEFLQFFKPFIQYAKDNVHVEDQYQQQWDNFIDNYISNAQHCCNGELAGKYRIITHGDAWTNNTMYRYENGEPVEICLFDFQVSRFGSPVPDIMQFLWTATEKPLRDLHYENLISMYHNTLSNFLKELGCDPEELFPYSALQDQLKQFGKYGLCISVFGTQMVYSRDQSTISANYKDECNKRLNDLANDVAKLGYI